jgi:hypothetical protein
MGKLLKEANEIWGAFGVALEERNANLFVQEVRIA